jgi:hypothetical protein
MAKKTSNIVHQYFRKEFEEAIILVKVNPLFFSGSEITVMKNGTVEVRELEFDQDIFEDLAEDGFQPASPLEFNLYFSGLAS